MILKREIKFRVKVKLETQTHMKTKIKAILKNDQNNKQSASLLHNKQSEIEKRFSYLETQRQNEAPTQDFVYFFYFSIRILATTYKQNSHILLQNKKPKMNFLTIDQFLKLVNF